jgi:citrate lyase subunit beta/citryl-CoA lyase
MELVWTATFGATPTSTRAWSMSMRMPCPRPAARTPWFAADLAAVDRAQAILLPKAESADDVRAVSVAHPTVPVVPLIETAIALQHVAEIADAPGALRLALGNVDLAADLGVDPASHAALLFARARIVGASAAARRAPPIDGVTTAIRDERALMADLLHARELGFRGKLLVHPAQVRSTAEALAPTDAEISWANAVLAAEVDGAGVHAGHMIDEPVLRRARTILAQAG